MEKPISEAQLRRLHRLLEEKGVTAKGLQRRLESGVLADIFESTARLDNRRRWRRALELTTQERLFRYTMPEGLSVSELISDYNCVSESWLADEFERKTSKETTLEFRRFSFNRKISSEEILEEIAVENPAHPWRSADLLELLFFGTKRLSSTAYGKDYLQTSVTISLGHQTFTSEHGHEFSPRIFDQDISSCVLGPTLAFHNINSSWMEPSPVLAVREAR